MQGTPRFTRRRALTTAAVGLLVVVVGQHPVGARPEGGEGVRHIEFTTSAPVLVGGDFGCDPTDAMRCAGTFRNVRTLTGDFAGTSYQVGAASPLADGTYQGASVQLFTGTIEGCGAGTLVIVEEGRLDPVSGAGWGTWRIADGAGTGDLAHVSGLLTADSRVSAVMSGSVRCS